MGKNLTDWLVRCTVDHFQVTVGKGGGDGGVGVDGSRRVGQMEQLEETSTYQPTQDEFVFVFSAHNFCLFLSLSLSLWLTFYSSLSLSLALVAADFRRFAYH